MTISMTVPSKCISIDTDLFISHTPSCGSRSGMCKTFLLYCVHLGYLSPQDIKVALDLHFEVDLRLSELLGSVVK